MTMPNDRTIPCWQISLSLPLEFPRDGPSYQNDTIVYFRTLEFGIISQIVLTFGKP